MAQPYVLEWLTSPLNPSPETIFDLPNTIRNVANQRAIPLAWTWCILVTQPCRADARIFSTKKCSATLIIFSFNNSSLVR